MKKIPLIFILLLSAPLQALEVGFGAGACRVDVPTICDLGTTVHLFVRHQWQLPYDGWSVEAGWNHDSHYDDNEWTRIYDWRYRGTGKIESVYVGAVYRFD